MIIIEYIEYVYLFIYSLEKHNKSVLLWALADKIIL